MKRRSLLCVIPAATLLYTQVAVSDITLVQETRITASGPMSTMNFKGQSTTVVSGSRGRLENSMDSDSGLLKMVAKNTNTATIVMAEEEKMVQLMLQDQQFSEMSFTEMRAIMERSMQQAEQFNSSGALPVSEEECQWSEPVVKVDTTRNKEKFAGVKAQQTLITASQTCHVPESGKQCELHWMLDYWMAKKMPGEGEVRHFQGVLAHAFGGEDMLSLARVQSRGLMGMFKGGWDEVLGRSGEMEGYPVKTIMSLEIGGQNCTVSSGAPIAMDGIWSHAADAGIDAAADTAAAHAGSALGRETAEAMGDSVGGSIAGSAIGAAGQKLISGAFGKFRKRKKDKVPESNSSTAGMVKLFSVSTELTHIDLGKVSDQLFQVPVGWKQVDNPSWQ